MAEPPPEGQAEDQPGWAAPENPSAAWQAPAAPPPAPLAPPPAGESAAPPRRSRAWIVILAVVMGVALIAGAAGTLLFVDRSLPPFDAANDWVSAMDDGRFNDAYDMLCAADKKLDDPEGFRSAFSDLFDGRSVSTNPLSVDRDGDRATVEFTVNHSGTANNDAYELPLRDENGDWRPCPGDSLRS